MSGVPEERIAKAVIAFVELVPCLPIRKGNGKITNGLLVFAGQITLPRI